MKTILLIFAHPDDESFSMGGTIAKLADGGAAIYLISATRGEEGLPGNPPLCLPEEVGEVRTEEAKRAAKILGIKKIFFLGLRDGTLIKFSTKYLSNLILPIMKHLNPDEIYTFISGGISGHDDHIVISKASTLSYKQYVKETKNHPKLYYVTLPESLVEKLKKEGMVKDIFKHPFKGSPDLNINYKSDIRDVLDLKIKSLKCHQTQHQDWERMLKRLEKGYLDYEYFIKFNIDRV